jgi:8-oxo-dGTP diphosphatase
MKDKSHLFFFGVKAIIRNNNKFLIMHKKSWEKGIWELPGGRMELGENAEETLAREIMEETGLTVTPLRLLDTWKFLTDACKITGVIYLCDKKDGEIKLSHEHDEYKWVEFNEETLEQMHTAYRERMRNWNPKDLF